jgi:Skp family chaperone for outer membrane proteins
MFRKFLSPSLVGAVIVLSALPAAAQSKVFVVNDAQVRGETKLGKAINGQLAGIRAQLGTQLDMPKLQGEVAAEEQRLKPLVEGLTEDALKKNTALNAQVEALRKKQVEFLSKNEQINRAVEERAQILQVAFNAVMEPTVEFVAKEVSADVVVPYSSTWYVKEASDISMRVIARLDATIPTLEALQAALPQPPAPQPAAAGAPAAATAPKN